MNRRDTALTLALSVGFCAGLSGRVASGDTPPSTWDLARDPTLRSRWALHRQVEGLMPDGYSENDSFDVQAGNELRLEQARTLLEEANVAKGSDRRLLFDLGRVYEELANMQHRNDLHQHVIDTLGPLLVSPAADSAADTQALEDLVYAYAKLDRPREELATWKKIVPLLFDDRARVEPLMNMGEAEMRLGRLDDAVATFQDVLQKCERLPNSSSVNSTYALALWDLAVVLDREGDEASALRWADKARKFVVGLRRDSAGVLRPVDGWYLLTEDPDVFFVPDWEREWYLGLGDGAAAANETDPREAAELWGQAEQHWQAYWTQAAAVEEVDAADFERGKRPLTHWAGIAKRKRDRAHAQKLVAEQRARASPALPSPAPAADSP